MVQKEAVPASMIQCSSINSSVKFGTVNLSTAPAAPSNFPLLLRLYQLLRQLQLPQLSQLSFCQLPVERPREGPVKLQCKEPVKRPRFREEHVMRPREWRGARQTSESE